MDHLTDRRADATAAREQRFREMFQAAYPPVLAFVRRRYATDAEAVVAETFATAWRRFEEIPADTPRRMAWLFATARNGICNALRADRRRDALAVRAASDPAGLTLEPDQVAARIDLARAWNDLPADAQETLALTYFDGLDAADAGLVLGVSPTAYRARLSRARKALSAHLTPEIDDTSAARSSSTPDGDPASGNPPAHLRPAAPTTPYPQTSITAQTPGASR